MWKPEDAEGLNTALLEWGQAVKHEQRRDHLMNTVKVKKDELLEKIKANRNTHTDVFERALVKYRELAIKELDAMLVEARQGKRIRRTVSLVEPVNHTTDYDRVIGMLEMHIEAEIELSAAEYQMYVDDDWGWKGQFTATNSRYVDE